MLRMRLDEVPLQGVYNYLTNITGGNAENDLVFMMDALDAWLQLSPRTLMERFDELGSSGVVTGGDTLCWPNKPESVSLLSNGFLWL